MNNIRTEVLTLSVIDLQNYQFVIPSYQRPYVWHDDDVIKLFDDILAACIADEDNYFIGTALSALGNNNDSRRTYELIDGQQRTTTLILIALAFKEAEVNKPISQVAIINNNPRLTFAIREQVQQLLGARAGLETYVHPGDEAIEKNPYLTRIAGALRVLSQKVMGLEEEQRSKLAEYICSRVQWVNNIVPREMDLNHLFATMNTTGIQLEQTDILKSKLLKYIKSDKAIYNAIWVACEHMENYFERNVRQLFPRANWNALQPNDLAAFKRNIFCLDLESKIENDSNRSGLSITEIAQPLNGDESNEYLLGSNESQNQIQKDELNTETVYCRSIIGFPLLLLHAYRIFLANKYQDDIKRLHSDHLLEAFEPLIQSNEEDVKNFFETLWKVRYQFDYWVVKWVERDDSSDEKLLLTGQSNSESYIKRDPKEVSDLVQLQSVRNFTGERSAQYWLTPFIASLIEKNTSDEKQALDLLEHIDNQLSLAAKDETQKSASFKLASDMSPETLKISFYLDHLRTSKGTGFEHYWFQKLEYLLWKKRASIEFKNEKDKEKFQKYRIASRNSVEHVHPQHEEHQRKLCYDFLNSFGNLVLLSPGENSSYSNQAVNRKKAYFESKPHYDSLKLRYMFYLMGDGEWGATQIMEHRDSMLCILESHYNGMPAN